MTRPAGAPKRKAAKRKAAKRPAPRTVTVTIPDGPFEGWEATARADFPAGWLVELESKTADRALAVLDRIVIDHNLPNGQDEVAETLADVEPYDGLMVISAAIGKAIGSLPPR